MKQKKIDFLANQAALKSKWESAEDGVNECSLIPPDPERKERKLLQEDPRIQFVIWTIKVVRLLLYVLVQCGVAGGPGICISWDETIFVCYKLRSSECPLRKVSWLSVRLCEKHFPFIDFMSHLNCGDRIPASAEIRMKCAGWVCLIILKVDFQICLYFLWGICCFNICWYVLYIVI